VGGPITIYVSETKKYLVETIPLLFLTEISLFKDYFFKSCNNSFTQLYGNQYVITHVDVLMETLGYTFYL
jgi:hypothetical protein